MNKIYQNINFYIMEQQTNNTENQINATYELEYGYIPQLVEWYRTEQIPVEALLDLNWMKDYLLSCGYQDFEFNFNDFSCKPAIIDDNHIMVLYTFPEPYMTPLAKYGAILLQKFHKSNARYYTLERSDDIVYNTGKINWVLGSMGADGRRANLGHVEECQTVDDFKVLIAKKVNKRTIKNLFKRLFKWD